MVERDAELLCSFEPYGHSVLGAASGSAKSGHNGSGRYRLFPARDSASGASSDGECQGEWELYWEHNRVLWSGGGVTHRQFTLHDPILEATLCRFEEHGGLEALTVAALHESSVSLCSPSGSVSVVPLPAPGFRRLSHLPAGLLVSAGPGVAPVLLSSPFKEPERLQAASGVQRRSLEGEEAVWSDFNANVVVTWSSALQRHAVWEVERRTGGDGPEVEGAAAAAAAAATAAAPATPAPTSQPFAGGIGALTPTQRLWGVSPSPGSASRLAAKGGTPIRTKDGRLSPAIFTPNPRAAMFAAAEAAAPSPAPSPAAASTPSVLGAPPPLPPLPLDLSLRGPGSLPVPSLSREPKVWLSLLWEEPHGASAAPASSGHLASGALGEPLLCLLLPRRSRLLCLAFEDRRAAAATPPGGGGGEARGGAAPAAAARVAFEIPAVAAAAVEGTRTGEQRGPRQKAPPGLFGRLRAPLDLLVLEPGGQLGLYVGKDRLCSIAVPGSACPGAPEAMEISSSDGAAPKGRLPAAQPDASDDDDDMSMGTSSPDPTPAKAPGAPQRPEAAPLAAVRDACGSRFTAELADGSSLRLALRVRPVSQAAAAVFAALGAVLEPESLAALSRGLLGCSGFGEGDSDAEWEAVKSTVRRWAEDPGSSRLNPEQPTAKQGSAPGAASAWEAMLSSRMHRQLLSGHRFDTWLSPEALRGGPATPAPRLPVGEGGSGAAPEVLSALQGLHAVYEELKMNQLTWQLVPLVAELAAQVSAVAGADLYLDCYARDLSPEWLSRALRESSAGCSPGGALPGAQNLSPASTHRALSEWLQGRDGSSCLQLLPSGDSAAEAALWRVLPRTAALAACYERIGRSAQEVRGALDTGRDVESIKALVLKGSEAVVLSLADFGWTPTELDSLPPGAALPLQEAIQRCREEPPPGWPVQAYVLLAREDIVASVGGSIEADDGPTEAALAFGPGSNKAEAVNGIKGGGVGGQRGVVSGAEGMPYLQRLTANVGAEEAQRHRAARSSELVSGADGPSSSTAPSATATAAVDGTPGTDGMEGINNGESDLRFGEDQRLLEVRRLLSSAYPVVVKAGNSQEASDPELTAAHQTRLTTLAVRTMGLPVGRGAFALATLRLLPTDPFTIPPLCMAGRLPEKQNATINLDLTSNAPAGGACTDVTAWPEFHNGAAAGLSMSPGGTRLTRTWIVYNKPSQPNYTHAGTLMALGLMGNLGCLSAADLFTYLSQGHDATMIGVLLGMAAAHRGTMEDTTNRMLFLHLPTRHPANFPELELSSTVQASALMGVGLLYEGSCHRLVAEMLVQEIGRRPGASSGPSLPSTGLGGASQDREGYALAAGMALGLVTLGKGRNATGLTDLALEDRLRFFMCGPSDPGLMGMGALHTNDPGLKGMASLSCQGSGGPGFTPSEAPSANGARNNGDDAGLQGSGVSNTVMEGSLVNLDVTSPAATVALMLMYLKTNDSAVAARFTIPDTHFALDFVRPDFILLRMLGRSIIMWDDIQPTEAWVNLQLPKILRGDLAALMEAARAEGPSVDAEAIAQAHCHAIAGACLAIGLRYAGTADARAKEVLTERCKYFLTHKSKAPDVCTGAAATAGSIDKQNLEVCLGTTALALSVVMAGTGDLATLKLIRGLRRRLSPAPATGPAAAPGQSPSFSGSGGLSYGNHMAVSMALGFLFLGGGKLTFSRSSPAIAALVISLFMRFPQSPGDNRFHLQAFRHLFVLAAEPRCVTAVDVDTRMPVYVPLRVHCQAGRRSGRKDAPAELSCTAPCLLPERELVKMVQVEGPRYRSQTLQGDQLKSLYSSHTIFVKRKAGVLSHAGDPSGGRSLQSRALAHISQRPLVTTPGACRAAALTALPGSDQSPSAELSGADLVNLCAMLSAPPFITAFAERVCSQSLPLSAGTASHQAARDFQAFCSAALHECLTLEKPHALPMYLTLYTWQQSLLGLSRGAEDAGRLATHGLEQGGITGNVGPTLPVMSLKLVREYYGSPVGEAVAAVAASQGASSAAACEPLLQVPFVEGLWQQLQDLWRSLGCYGPQEGGSASLLARYASASGLLAAAQTDVDQGDAQRWALFGSFLEATGIPASQKLQEAGLAQSSATGRSSTAARLSAPRLREATSLTTSAHTPALLLLEEGL